MRRDGIPLASCSSKGVVDKSYSLKLNFKTDERPICFQREQNNSDPVMKYFKTDETTNVQFVSSDRSSDEFLLLEAGSNERRFLGVDQVIREFT